MCGEHNSNSLNKGITEKELNLILNQFNDTKHIYDENVTVHELFERQVAKTPDLTAVIYKDKKLTYKELDTKANSVAGLLRSMGVGRDTIVGIMVERSFEMIIGIFAILKAGGAYLPILPSYPNKRIEYMLEEGNVNILLTQDSFVYKIDYQGNVINLNNQDIYLKHQEKIENINQSRDLAYVIFTSGSTGKPKGSMIEHRSLVNRINWMHRKYPIGENDVILQKTPYGFDVSVWEIFWWSLVGASVCMLEPNYEKFPQAIEAAIHNNKVSVMHFVPSMLNMFLEYIRRADNMDSFASLRTVFSSGEALPVSLVKTFNENLYKSNGTRLINLYGPTEATIDVTYYNCPVEGDIDKIPIGQPIDNTKIFIVADNTIQPIGATGEICISGDGLARGYLNRPELNIEKFTEFSFLPGVRMYRTGDLGTWLPNGQIEYLGRIDQQVKIRGLRIELEEIEAVINEYCTGITSAVLVKKSSETLTSIVAIMATSVDIPIENLKKHMKTLLPEYMIPNKFLIIDKMPLTTNGKLNRAELETYLD